MGALRRSHPRFERAGIAPRVELTTDDIDILRRVFRYRFVRAEDLYRLYPERSADKLSRRLMRLYRNGFIDRPIAQVNRDQSGGSQSLVYGLDTSGARLLSERFGLSVGSGDWKSRNRSYTRENLDHTLAVSRFLIDLELGCRARGNLELIPQETITDGGKKASRWSVPVSWHGLFGTVQIAPDAIVGLRGEALDGKSRRTFLFVEVDRGTMTIVPAREVREREAFLYRATILRKLLTYATSYQLALHNEYLGLPTARVLFVTTTEVRAGAMREAAERFILPAARIPPGLFLFGSVEMSHAPIEKAWIDAAGTHVHLVHSEDGGQTT